MELMRAEENFSTKLGNLIIKKLIGKGKSGHSYLAEFDDTLVVLKIMHDEPNSYYQFTDNKVKLEWNAFNKLNSIGIRIPYLIEHNAERNYIIKNYIEGDTAAEKIARSEINESIVAQLFEMSNRLRKEKVNIDYFPTNFVIDDTGTLYYIDYEINPFMQEWSLEEWGIYYWANSQGFSGFLKSGDASLINSDINKGIPIKDIFSKRVSSWIEKYSKISNAQ